MDLDNCPLNVQIASITFTKIKLVLLVPLIKYARYIGKTYEYPRDSKTFKRRKMIIKLYNLFYNIYDDFYLISIKIISKTLDILFLIPPKYQ